MNSAQRTSAVFGIIALLLLVFIGTQFHSFIELAIDQENARAAFASEKSPGNGHEFKNLTARLSIESLKMRVIYFTCVICVVISIISSFIAPKPDIQKKSDPDNAG